MSAFHTAFEAFLAAPGEGENGETPDTPSTSNSPGSEEADPHSPNSIKKTSVGIVVKAPSPEAEILATPIRKSTRQRRRKRFESESSTSGQTDSEEDVLGFFEDLDKMPTLSRDSSRSRRSNSKTKTPSPKAQPKNMNGVKSLIPKSTKDPKLFDLYSETECKLCDRKNFKSGSDSLVRHYALDHFREKLDAEVGNSLQVNNVCPICKIKKLKSRFETRKDILVHNASFHFRAQLLLADELGIDPNDPSVKNNKIPNYTRRPRTKSKESGSVSSVSVVEVDSSSQNSQNSQISHNGLPTDSKESGESSDNVEGCNKQNNVEEKEDEDTEDDSVEEEDSYHRKGAPRGPYTCQICQAKIATRTKMKRHGIDKHFYKSLQLNLPKLKPFTCPENECSFEGDTLQSLTRHSGIKHKGIDPYMIQLMGQALNETTRTPVKIEILKAEIAQEVKKKELWVIDKKSKTKNETWFVNKECTNSKGGDQNASDEEDESGNETETESQDSNDSKASKPIIKPVLGALRNFKNDNLQSPRTYAEFEQALKENLRTKDGAYCRPKDEKNIICVCGKTVRICNIYYWRYMVQKPRIQNGKIVSRGHWFNCEEVKKRGTDYVMDPKDVAELKEIIAIQNNPALKRQDSDDREEIKPKRMRTREKLEKSSEDNSEEDDEEAKEEARQMIIEKNISDLLESRVVGETFVQDGPCYFAASELSLCRECKKVPLKERDEMLLKGKFIEDTSNITCSFYSFRKLRMTRQAELMVAGYLDPIKDPKPEDLALWTPDKENPPADCDLEKTKYILGLIGDQFCQMVQQERKCLTVHMGANKNVTWKPSVKGVREMCDVCKTTLFNYHWICGVCGLFVCLDCYQFRRGGLVKDFADQDRTTDDYKWPYCSTGDQHLINNLMLAAIIPNTCLIDLAKKVHQLRVRWKIPQFCHQSDEIKGLFAQDDGFMNLQSSALNVAGAGRQVFFPCALCNNETFRWQFDLYKHYATKHFYDELLSQLNLEGEPPYKCPLCNVGTETERQILIHYGLTHKAVAKLLEKTGSVPRPEICHRLPGIRSNIMAAPTTYKCPICSAMLPAKHKSDHLTVHFKDKISPLLAKDVPFSCPKCRYIAMDRSSLIRHFATRHGLVDAFLKDWLERHGRESEAASLEFTELPDIRPPPEAGVPECRLCEEFPIFFKNFDFHKHLADIHFRTVLNNDLPQATPFKCPIQGCPYDTKIRHNLTVHYGVTHRNVFKFYNAIMGFDAENEEYIKPTLVSQPGRGGSRVRGSYTTSSRKLVTTMETCMVCEEQVSKETMVFHLAHKHFQDKVSHLPQTRPFKCPECNHVNEFQGGLVKHYGNYHGVFNRILKDMGLLDAREDLSRNGVKFPRPKVDRVIAPGPNNNIALELARTAAIWSGNAREEEDVLKETAELKVLERKVENVLDNPDLARKLTEEKKESTVEVKQEKPDEVTGMMDNILDIKKELAEFNESPKKEVEDEETYVSSYGEKVIVECALCDNVPKMMNKSELLRHLVEKHFKQKMYAKLMYKAPDTEIKTEEGQTVRGTYRCPLCEFENCNQMNTARHYGIKHRFAHKIYEEILCKPIFSPNLTKDGVIDRRTMRGRPPAHALPPSRSEVSENCKICQVGQDSPAAYQRHLIKVHFKSKLLADCPRSKPFICPNEGCDIERRDRFNLLMHYGGCQKKVWKILDDLPEGSIQQLDDTSKSKCKLCGKYFTSARYMWTHMGDEHFETELNNELPSQSPWKCPKCPAETAYEGTDLRSLRVHYGTRHKSVMPHLANRLNIPLKELQAEFRPPNEIGKTCQFCKKSFYNQMDFLKHSLLHVRKRVYQDLPENEPYTCPRCPFTGGSRITLLLHYGLQHNVVLELLKEDPSTLMVDMDFIVKQRNGLGEEEKLRAVSEQAAGLPTSNVDRYPELDNKRFPKCKICHYRYFTKLDILRHFADDHLKEKLCASLGPDPGQYSLHRCPEPGCLRELKTRQQAWRHYGSAHGHLMNLMVSEFDFKMEDWALPMKEAELQKMAEDKQKALEDHKDLVKSHQESSRVYQEKLNQYHMDLARHQAMIQQAKLQAYNDNAETMAAQALAQMAGAPYQRPNPLANLPPAPVAPQGPSPVPPLPQPLKQLEDPNCMDITALPTLEWLDNAKISQNTCELCGEEFINTNKTRDKGNHQVNHFRDVILQSLPLPAHRFECPRCSFVGRDRNALLKHYGLSHRIVVAMVRKEMGGALPAEMAEVTFDCKVCSQFFLNQNALNNHLCDSHYGPRLAKDVPYSTQSPYKCPKCNYEAKTHQMTVRHYGVKHGLLRSFMIEDGYIARDPTPPPPPPPAPVRPPPPYPEMNMNRSLMNHIGQPSSSIQIPYRSGQSHHSSYSRSPSHHSPQYGSPINQSPNQSWIEHYMSPGASPVHTPKPDDVQLACPIQGCSATFGNHTILCRHATDKHFVDRFARELPQAPPFICPLCGHNAPDQMSLIRHWGISHKMAIKVFNEQVGRPNSFDSSILKNFEIRGVRENCPLCKGSFQGRQLLMRHLSDTHFKDRMCNGIPDQEGLIYKCPQCNHIARDRQSFVRHYGIVHKMVVKYLNEMGIHALDDEARNNSAPQSPAATPRTYTHNDSFSPRGYTEPLGSPGYFSPLSQTPQRSPAYHTSEVQPPYSNPYTSPAYTSPQYTSPQYVSQSPRTNIGSPQDLTMQYTNTRPQNYSQFDPMYGQPQDLSVSQPQDLSMALPQDLSKANKPIDFSNPSHVSQPQQQAAYQQQIQTQPVNLVQSQPQQQQYPARPTVVQQQQKPLHVLVNDPYRQPPTPGMPMTPSGSQHSNPGTPQPNTPHNISQPGTPQPSSVPASPASFRQTVTPLSYPQQPATEYVSQSIAPQTPTPQQRVIVQNHGPPIQNSTNQNPVSPAPTPKKPSDYMPQGDDHIQAPVPGTRGPYGIFCVHCNAVKARQPSDFYRHLAETHYKNYLAQYLPPPGNPPYRCPLCPYENKEMSPMIRHYGVAHKKVKEAIGNEIVGKYIPESEMAPCRPAKNQYSSTPQTSTQVVYENQPTINNDSQNMSQVLVKCPYHDCDMEFSARYAFWQHMCDKHLKEDLLKYIPIAPNQPYQCPFSGCNYVTKDSRQALVRHYGMTHKVVQGILGEKFPEFLTTDKFAQPPKPVRPRSKSVTPGRDGAPGFQQYEQIQQQHVQQQPVQPVQQVQQQQYIQHQGQPHIQQVQHPVQNQVQYVNYQQPSTNQVGYTTQQPAPQHIYQQSGTEQFDSLNSLNLDSLNPSDFSIPSLSEFLDNPGASFPNLSGEDLTHSGYVTAAGHAHHHMQFEPQMDGTFDPTSITDQSLDGSAGSNPTTPEKNKSTMSPATTPQTDNKPEIVKKPILPLKKYCEICGKEYEGKNKSMNKVQHMIHHFKEKLYQNLPPKTEDGLPYKCPEENCKFETKHKPDWARHYGSVHKIVDKMLKQYLEEHPEAWGNQTENKELLREQSPSVQSSPAPLPRPLSQASAPGSDHLDAGEGLLCKLTDLQQKCAPNPALLPSSALATAIQVTSLSLKVSAGQPIVVSAPSMSQGRLAVELPKSDLTKFITSALTEKNVPHAVSTHNKEIIRTSTSASQSLSAQQMLEQKVQSVINEQQQILNSQKAQMGSMKTEATSSLTQPVMSNTIRQPTIALPQQPVPVSMIQQHLVSTNSRSPVKLIQTENGAQLVKQEVVVKQEEGNMQQSIQQILQTQSGKHQNILIKDPKTGQQHLVVQTSQSGQHYLLQKSPNPQQQLLVQSPREGQQQQYIVQTTKDGQRQLVQVQGQPRPQQQIMVQTSQGNQQLLVQTSQPSQQMVVNPAQTGLRLQQSQQGTKLVQIETPQQKNIQIQQEVGINQNMQPVTHQQIQLQQNQANQQQLLQLQQSQSQAGQNQVQVKSEPIPNQVVSQGSQQGQQIIQSKIVQHNGRTYLVQVRAQKPIEPGKQIVIKTNQPGIGGSGLVQEVMDEVLRQQYQKQSEQQKISELAMQLQQQSQQHLEQQQSPKKTPVKALATGTKLTLQQQQLLLPTEPHPQIAAQHQMKQQELKREQQRQLQEQQQQNQRPTTSILQQQLELPMSQPAKISTPKSKVNAPVQCFLCQEMPWFPNQEHLDNHYSTAHGIMKPSDTLESELDNIPFSNADLEASLSSMTDLKDDAGDFESLLDALPPSPEPQDMLDPNTSDAVRRKSTGSHGMSTTRMCELCGFEPKTKNKSRERMDHLAMKHFRDQMINELRKDKPMKCPRCDVFESKDRQQLFRHMISKHKVLDYYLADAIEKMKSEGKQPFVSPSTNGSPMENEGPSTSQNHSPSVDPSTLVQLNIPQLTLPSFNCLPKEPELPTQQNEVSNMIQSQGQGALAVPMPQVTTDQSMGASHVSLAEFMDSGMLEENKPDRIMQVDGMDSCSESDGQEDGKILQLDGALDNSDSESTGIDLGDNDSEFSIEEHKNKEKGTKSVCPLCKEEMKFSRTYHFATTHFRPRLAKMMPTQKPFICPDCGEEQQHKVNLWSHYIGRAHKHLDEWLDEYNKAEVKPDWCDPNPSNPRKFKKTGSTSGFSNPNSPLVSGYSTPDRASPVGKEWFCDMCHGMVPQRKEIHYASLHFKEKLKTMLPTQAPFICPDNSCKAEHKHFLNLSTHFLTQHGHLKVWLEERGISYETSKKSKVVREGVESMDTVEEGGLMPIEPIQPTDQVNEFGKHTLSSSESDGDDEAEGTPERELLLSKVITITSLEISLDFLKQESEAKAQSSGDDITLNKIKSEIKNSSAFADESKTSKAIVKDEVVSEKETQKNHTPKNTLNKDTVMNGESSTSHSTKHQNSSPSKLDEGKERKQRRIRNQRKRAKKHLDYDLQDVIKSLLENNEDEFDPVPRFTRDPPPVRVMTTNAIYEDPPPHTWLCDGKLLVLNQNLHEGNIKLFQEQWRRGQPVIVANVSNNLDINLWHPNAFNAQFGALKHDIVNCKTHKLIPQVPLKWFWDGFESLNSRMLDKQGMPMLLKLKDWPPEDDFAQYFPNRFADLMKHLPLGDYTKREGRYNLASYIPEFFVRPDLGPKMYIAYGSPLYPEFGSTNLHLDMSDAVNLIVYVGIPQDGNRKDHFEEGLKAVDEAGCDLATKTRVRRKGTNVGALWHVFHPRDADKIRDFLNKVSIEKGHKLEPHNDPIHDQSVYLDGKLRNRLFEEYGVVGYAYAQCEGDTIFIPAGAPHQVRNIHNCIKVAEDFVSPENLEWCFYQTEEFRHLTDNHTQHEDKLQIKNILYHAVKDCVAVLENYELKNNGRTC